MLKDGVEQPQDVAGSDHDVQELLLLAGRLRASHGGELDDAAIFAVSEATGAPTEYVRLALKSVPEQEKHPSFIQKVRRVFLSIDPTVRRFVTSGYLACGMGFVEAVKAVTGDRTSLMGVLQILLSFAAAYNVGLARDRRTASLAGAIFGAASFLSYTLIMAIFSLFTPVPTVGSSVLMVLFGAIGAVSGIIVHSIVGRNRQKLGLQDPVQERQELLRQLVDLQDKLKSAEQAMAFLSLDVVNSTAMKTGSDRLAVEFTFNEYHRFVEAITVKHGGTVHSTAGDGMTCAFAHPQQAFAAARNIQAGLFELNALRNKIGKPIGLRAGIHFGEVAAPGADVQNVNIAHVIDIAAHLQKQCPEGGIVVSHSAAHFIPGGAAAVGTDYIESHDVRGYIWRPKAKLAMPAFDAPVPAPESS